MDQQWRIVEPSSSDHFEEPGSLQEDFPWLPPLVWLIPCRVPWFFPPPLGPFRPLCLCIFQLVTVLSSDFHILMTPPPQQNRDLQRTLASCWSPCFLKVVCTLRLLHQAEGYMFMLVNHHILGGVRFFRMLSDICFSSIIMCLCVCPCLLILKEDLKTSPAICPVYPIMSTVP